MERLTLNATKRGVGKGVARKLRRENRVPAILYGKVETPIPLSVNARELTDVTAGESGSNILLDLTIEKDKPQLAFLKNIQADSITREITHADFLALSLEDKIEVEVPIRLLGKPAGVKEGGVLDQIRRTLHVRSLPNEIPAHLDIDVSTLIIGQSVHADEIALPDGVDFPHTSNFTVATVVPPTKEEVVAAEEEPVEGEEGAEGVVATPDGEGKGEAGAEKAAGEKKEESKEKK